MRSKYKHTHIYISNTNLAVCSESITQNKYHDDDHAFISVSSFRIGNYLKDDINIYLHIKELVTIEKDVPGINFLVRITYIYICKNRILIM